MRTVKTNYGVYFVKIHIKKKIFLKKLENVFSHKSDDVLSEHRQHNKNSPANLIKISHLNPDMSVMCYTMQHAVKQMYRI